MTSSASLTLEAVDHVGLIARDLAAMRDFYGSVLGLPVIPVRNDMFIVQAPNLRLLVFQARDAERHPGVQRDIDNFARNLPGYDHLTFRVADVDAAAAVIEARGVKITWAGEFPGVARVRRFLDPEGNAVGILQPLSPAR